MFDKIKTLVSAGFLVSYQYKLDMKTWVGSIKLFSMSSSEGHNYVVSIDGDVHRCFPYHSHGLNDAIRMFYSKAFSKENLGVALQNVVGKGLITSKELEDLFYKEKYTKIQAVFNKYNEEYLEDDFPPID